MPPKRSCSSRKNNTKASSKGDQVKSLQEALLIAGGLPAAAAAGEQAATSSPGDEDQPPASPRPSPKEGDGDGAQDPSHHLHQVSGTQTFQDDGLASSTHVEEKRRSRSQTGRRSGAPRRSQSRPVVIIRNTYNNNQSINYNITDTGNNSSNNNQVPAPTNDQDQNDADELPAWAPTPGLASMAIIGFSLLLLALLLGFLLSYSPPSPMPRMVLHNDEVLQEENTGGDAAGDAVTTSASQVEGSADLRQYPTEAASADVTTDYKVDFRRDEESDGATAEEPDEALRGPSFSVLLRFQRLDVNFNSALETRRASLDDELTLMISRCAAAQSQVPLDSLIGEYEKLLEDYKGLEPSASGDYEDEVVCFLLERIKYVRSLKN